MSKDISSICDGWEFESGRPVVRRIMGDDGRPKIQLRLDLGVLQMEVDGRPDGKRPYGKKSMLEHYQSMLVNHRERHGSDRGFRLNMEDVARLHQESTQFYHRYVAQFALEDFAGVVRDTEHNLKLMDFVYQYAEPQEMGASLTQFRPYVLMMHARAGANVSLAHGNYDEAIERLETSIDQIREFYAVSMRPELTEVSPELKILESRLAEIKAARPLSRREVIEKALEDAIRREDYERAALLRDQLKALDQPIA